MRRIYWFYDVSSGIFRDKEVIWIWALDENGDVHVLVDPMFKNYFYVLREENPFNELKAFLTVKLGEDANFLKIEAVKKKLFGRDHNFYMVSGEDSILKRAVSVMKQEFGSEVLFNDDIRFSTKYILEKNINPCSWYEYYVESAGIEKEVSFETLKNFIAEVLEKPYPPLNIVGVDILIASEYGAPDPKQDPILSIIAYNGKEFFEAVLDGENDYTILKSFDNFIDKNNPRVIVTYNGNSFIWPYVIERLKQLKLSLTIGMLDIELHQSLYGHISLAGRIHIDLKEYADDVPVLQRKTLEELADFLSLPPPPRVINEFRYYDFWKDNRENLLDYQRWRVKTLYNAFSILSNHIFSLSSITGIPPDYVLTASSGRQAEHYIMRKAHSFNEVIPKVIERRFRSYPGGLVLKPIKGLHKNIAVIDYKSMYPTLIIKHNVSPETIVKESGSNVEFYNELGIGIRQDVEGLLPMILRNLVEERDNIKRLMSSVDSESVKYRILNARQRILKILANTMYGYMGWLGARWYSWKGASLVTYLGRNVIKRSLEKAKSLGLKVIYGDTDSLFINYDKNKINTMLKWIEEELGLEAKIEKIYKTLLFTEAKKRYAGLTSEHKLDIVGLEYVRRDWCDYARETQYILLKHLLKGEEKSKLLDEFRRRVLDLRRKRVQLEKLILWVQLTKAPEEYKANAPHISVARYLIASGWRIRKGMFIGYVINEGEGPLYKRVVHYLDADPAKIDVNYYIMNQLLPVAKRILEPVGISRKTLESIARGSSLGLDAFSGVP